jgi:hypothetical protein
MFTMESVFTSSTYSLSIVNKFTEVLFLKCYLPKNNCVDEFKKTRLAQIKVKPKIYRKVLMLFSFILLAPGYAQQSLPLLIKLNSRIITITFMMHNSLIPDWCINLLHSLQGERVIYKVVLHRTE